MSSVRLASRIEMTTLRPRGDAPAAHQCPPYLVGPPDEKRERQHEQHHLGAHAGSVEDPLEQRDIGDRARERELERDPHNNIGFESSPIDRKDARSVRAANAVPT